jgi:Protein of unknown function (DUF4242)
MSSTYLVECYWPGVSVEKLDAAMARSSEDAEAELLAAAGVSWLDSILITADEIVLCLFEGPSADEVLTASLGVGLPAERVVESVRIARELNR